MASKADFTEEEGETMRKGVAGAGMLVSVGDRDFTGTFGEAGALAKPLGQEREAGGSEFIRELAAGRPAGFGLTASAQEVEAGTLEALRSTTAILAAKAPDEAESYRQLALDVADAVANAKGGIKRGGTAAIDKMKEAVGTA